jgi:hypothetical protein
MKISIALSLLVLAIAGTLGTRVHRQLAAAREDRRRLIAEAAPLGISIDPTKPSQQAVVTRHSREDREANARKTASDLIAFVREMEALETKGAAPDEAGRERMLEIMDRLRALDPARLNVLIAAVRENPELSEKGRQQLVGFSIMTLATTHPESALTLYAEFADCFKDPDHDGSIDRTIRSVLARLAKDDPLAALEWMKQNGAKFPDLVTDESKTSILAGAAARDPALALKLIGELGLKDANAAVKAIAGNARTPEELSALLPTLREYLATIPDELARMQVRVETLATFGKTLAGQNFETVRQWLGSAKLDAVELESIACGLSYSINSEDGGKWIEWLGTSLLPEKSGQFARIYAFRWTQNDYKAANQWLLNAPDGPLKQAAIRGFAESVSHQEPESAAAWAVTLPAGKERDETLKQIYVNWPKGNDADKAAAEAFAREHGLK